MTLLHQRVVNSFSELGRIGHVDDVPEILSRAHFSNDRLEMGSYLSSWRDGFSRLSRGGR